MKILSAEEKETHKKLLKEAEENYRTKPKRWQEKNIIIEKKIAQLFEADIAT